MPLISMRQLLDYAAENDFGMPAFNVNNMEQVHAIMQAADEVDSPVIMQGSAGARSYAGEPFLRHLILAAIEAYPHIPIVMHQDHGSSPAVCLRSIQSGFSSVMMDGSLGEDGKTPMSYDYNVEVTRTAVKMAHACGVSVEGELGCLGSLETGEAGEEDGIGAEGTLQWGEEGPRRFIRPDGATEDLPALPQADVVFHECRAFVDEIRGARDSRPDLELDLDILRAAVGERRSAGGAIKARDADHGGFQEPPLTGSCRPEDSVWRRVVT